MLQCRSNMPFARGPAGLWDLLRLLRSQIARLRQREADHSIAYGASFHSISRSVLFVRCGRTAVRPPRALSCRRQSPEPASQSQAAKRRGAAMSALKDGRSSLGGGASTASRSPAKGRRSALADTAASRRPTTAGDRPEGGSGLCHTWCPAACSGRPSRIAGAALGPHVACQQTLLALFAIAERVRVFVRIRPTKAEGETPGALRVKSDGRGVVVYRE